MMRNDIGSPHFEQRGLLILPTNIAHPPLLGLARRLPRVEACEPLEALWGRFGQILCSEGDGCLESDRCLRSDPERGSFENEICAMLATRRN